MTTATEGDDAARERAHILHGRLHDPLQVLGQARGEAVQRRALPPLTRLMLPRVS